MFSVFGNRKPYVLKHSLLTTKSAFYDLSEICMETSYHRNGGENINRWEIIVNRKGDYREWS